MMNALTQRDSQRPKDILLYYQRRSADKLTIANTRGDTTDELAETLAEGTGSLEHQRDDRGFLHAS